MKYLVLCVSVVFAALMALGAGIMFQLTFWKMGIVSPDSTSVVVGISFPAYFLWWLMLPRLQWLVLLISWLIGSGSLIVFIWVFPLFTDWVNIHWIFFAMVFFGSQLLFCTWFVFLVRRRYAIQL